MKSFDKIMDKITVFESSHEKISLPLKEQMIKDLLLRLQMEQTEDESIIINHKTDGAEVILRTTGLFVSGNEAPTLRNLISLSDIFFIENEQNRIKLTMSFSFWKYQKKPEI